MDRITAVDLVHRSSLLDSSFGSLLLSSLSLSCRYDTCFKIYVKPTDTQIKTITKTNFSWKKGVRERNGLSLHFPQFVMPYQSMGAACDMFQWN